ncbi:hypothetical protein K470DRAFT_260387 [Piedraia hortae CBS 480.64]|uniref:Uncharacterized protein n=1 Tax=Piedraia hortae CBS 480.64 TaxID=1314780 RepID=A0A6A7BSF2_9PEZI|nr:hypothetical protein K470DRAFT_260387 [Piedraia hortae CBS 480.64]
MMNFLMLLLLPAMAMAATVQLNNHCSSSIYVTIANASGTAVPGELKSGQAFLTPFTGLGNSFGITTTQDAYWSPTGEKLILGASVDGGSIYWTLSSVNKSPVTPYQVTGCGGTKEANGVVRTCGEGEGIVLEVCA